jgi:hypothetical protein
LRYFVKNVLIFFSFELILQNVLAQTQIWTEKITLKTTQAFVVGGGVGALTGLFLFGTALHTNTNVNYDAPWREQFKQMGKEAKTTVRWWTRTGAVYSGLITGFQAIIDKV